MILFRPGVRSQWFNLTENRTSLGVITEFASLQNIQTCQRMEGSAGVASPLFELSLCALPVLPGLSADCEAPIRGPLSPREEALAPTTEGGNCVSN